VRKLFYNKRGFIMRPVTSQNELRQLHYTAKGFIYSDSAGTGPGGQNYNILHRAGCRWVKKTKVLVPRYYFDTLDEAYSWLEQNRGLEGQNWRRCKSCRPRSGRHPIRVLRTSASEAEGASAAKAAGPFKERQVQGLLVDWFQNQGYQAQTQAPVKNGIVDVLVSVRDREWVIEVKGEDRGGYASAQMNFQMGIGQILSRMADPTKVYALAFPATKDYGRVVEKYQGTFGADKLGLYLITVSRDGAVEGFAGSDINELIESLRN
jgi:hypothetical protein